MKWNNGNKYEGNWLKDKMSGYGKLFINYGSDKGNVYEGCFVDGKI